MSERTAPRPPQVTFGGGVILVGSIFVLFSVFETVAGLRSIETRESVEKMLSEPPLEGTGLGLQSLLDLMHVSAMVAGGCAAATAILGGYVLRRNLGARLAVTVLAVPLFLAGMVSGGFASSMVAVAVVLLWTRPARDWFAGRTPPPRREQPRATPEQPRRPEWPPPLDPPTDSTQQPSASGGEPRPYSGFGSVPTGPIHGTGAQRRAPQDPTKERPRELVAACVLAWIFSAIVLVSMLIGLVVFSADDTVIRDMYESDTRLSDAGVSVAALRVTALITCALFTLWSLAAIVVGALAYVGQNWARWALFVSAILAALLSVLLMFTAPVVLVVTGVAAYVAVLLTRPPVTTWLTRPRNPNR